MSESGVRRLIHTGWWVVLLLSLVFLLLALPGFSLRFQKLIFFDDSSFSITNLQKSALLIGAGISIFGTVLSIVLACLVYWRKPGDPMAVFFSFYLLFYAIFMTGPIEVVNAYWLPDQPDLAIKLQTIFFPLPNVVLFMLFPNGRFRPRWSWVLLVVTAFISLTALFIGGDELLRPSMLVSQVLFGLLYGVLLLSISLQVYRYRSVYTYIERQQTKWALLGIISWFIAMGVSSIPYYYLLYQPPGTPAPWWQPIMSAFWWLTLCILPVAFTIAILRSRLWDIDILIRRTLQYTLLTALLALVYFGGVTLLQAFFTALAGHQSPAAVVISTLVIAALFNPLRNRLQDFIDERFYRQKYNAEKALADFAMVTRSETNLEVLTAQVVGLVERTMQPEQVRLWLRSDMDKMNEKRQG